MAENKRIKIVALKQAGHSSKDVAKMVIVEKRFNDAGTTLSKRKCGRKRTLCTKALGDVVRKRISRNLGRSVRKLAKTLGVAGTTMRSVVHDHLGMKSYKIQRRQLISALSKEKRLQRWKNWQ